MRTRFFLHERLFAIRQELPGNGCDDVAGGAGAKTPGPVFETGTASREQVRKHRFLSIRGMYNEPG